MGGTIKAAGQISERLLRKRDFVDRVRSKRPQLTPPKGRKGDSGFNPRVLTMTQAEKLAQQEEKRMQYLNKVRSKEDWKCLQTMGPTAREIVRDVCDKHQLTPVEVTSRRRSVHLLPARFECYWKLYGALFTMSQIAGFFNKYRNKGPFT